MKTISLILLTTISNCLSIVFAQTSKTEISYLPTKISKTEPYKKTDLMKKQIFPTTDGVVVIKYSVIANAEIMFQVFKGEEIKLVSTKVEKIPGEYFYVESIEKMGEHIYMFYSIIDSRKKTSQLFVKEVSQDVAGFTGDAQQIVNTTESLVYSSRQKGKYSFFLSDGKETILIKYKFLDKEKNSGNKYEKVRCIVLDSKLDQVWENDATLPYNESQMGKGKFTITDNADCYAMYEKKADNELKGYVLFKIQKDGEVTELPVDFKGKKLTDFKFSEFKNNEVVVAGYYSNTNDNVSNGFFLMKLNEKGIEMDPEFHEFSSDFIKEYVDPKKIKSNISAEVQSDKGVIDLEITDVLQLENNEILLSGNSKIKEYYTTESGGTGLDFTYREIILLKINAKGELIWSTKIPRLSRNGGYLISIYKNEIHLVFTDNPSNFKLPLNKSANYTEWGGEMTLCKVNLNDANREYYPLFQTLKINGVKLYDGKISDMIRLSENSFAFEVSPTSRSEAMYKIHIK